MSAIIIRRVIGAVLFVAALVSGYLLKTHGTPGGKKRKDTARTKNIVKGR